MKKIKIDVGMCSGCGQCALVCAFRNVGVFDLEQSNIRTAQWEEICLTVSLMCQQCRDAPCIAACPSEAISVNPATGAIAIDLDICTQCQACTEECRYEVIHISPQGNPVTCDLCGGEPACVLACYPQALSFEETSEKEWEPFKKYAERFVERVRGRNVPPPSEWAEQKAHEREAR
jgi:Fe-S-cluster-containing dehydrogenase component